MADRKVEDFKKSITKCVDKWNQEHAKFANQIAEIVKQVEALTTQIKAVNAKAGDAIKGLGLAILDLKVPEDADEKELAKVPAWLEQLIKSKTSSTKQFISVSTSPDFNGKPKTLMLTASWYLHQSCTKFE